MEVRQGGGERRLWRCKGSSAVVRRCTAVRDGGGRTKVTAARKHSGWGDKEGRWGVHWRDREGGEGWKDNTNWRRRTHTGFEGGATQNSTQRTARQGQAKQVRPIHVSWVHAVASWPWSRRGWWWGLRRSSRGVP